MNKSESSLRLHKHHRRAMDGVSDGRSGRSNIWWPAGWERGVGGGRRNKVRQLSGETAASRSRPSVVYTVESVSMQKKKHPEKHKKLA